MLGYSPSAKQLPQSSLYRLHVEERYYGDPGFIHSRQAPFADERRDGMGRTNWLWGH